MLDPWWRADVDLVEADELPTDKVLLDDCNFIPCASRPPHYPKDDSSWPDSDPTWNHSKAGGTHRNWRHCTAEDSKSYFRYSRNVLMGYGREELLLRIQNFRTSPQQTHPGRHPAPRDEGSKGRKPATTSRAGKIIVWVEDVAQFEGGWSQDVPERDWRSFYA